MCLHPQKASDRKIAMNSAFYNYKVYQIHHKARKRMTEHRFKKKKKAKNFYELFHASKRGWEARPTSQFISFLQAGHLKVAFAASKLKALR